MTISFVSIFTFVWILENKSREPLKTRQYVTAETLTGVSMNLFKDVYETCLAALIKNKSMEIIDNKLGTVVKYPKSFWLF